MIRVLLLFLLALSLSMPAGAQASFADKVQAWKIQFPKRDVVAHVFKEVVEFQLNPAPKPGEGKVQARVTSEIQLVPLKDFMKFEDGLFYYDELQIEGLKATSAEGKNVAVDKLCGSYQEDNIFHSDMKLCVVRFPLAEKGKPFTYTYTEHYRDVKFLTSVYFNQHLPAVERLIEFRIPAWLDVDLREFNFAGAPIEKATRKEGDLTVATFRMKDVPASPREGHAPSRAHSMPHLVCVSKAVTANGARQPLFESVKDLYGWYSSVCAEIGNRPEELKERVTALTAGKKTDLEKVEAIFYWVQDNIRYIAFEDGIMGFKPDAAQNVLQKKYGDCKGKANLLKEMLKLAGFDARLTWIGTSDLPYDYTLPSLAVDNHMICTVIVGGKKYYLDGTEYYMALNDYAQRIQGKQVLIEDGKNYIIEKVPEFPADHNKVKLSEKLAIDGVALSGSSAIEYNGESKSMLQSVYATIRNDKKEDALGNYLRKGNDNVVVANMKNSDVTERQKPLQVSYTVKTSNQVTRTGNELYVGLDWDKDFGDLEMPADRLSDYEFSQKYHYTVQKELQLPEGYKVDYLPAALKKAGPGCSFEGSYSSKGRTIVYTKTIVISKPILRKADFPAWNAFLSDVNKFYNEQVVLTK
ncbi:transglutaminase domain-containing protein [Flaviaesturariibacter amylovorans]|uniref:Transglutaminase-like domain-containing protein n=1 Tax=Flaviaesturariibacter amylovorans TaxID=1084520 RepID=A0ABP8GK16_9BACT